MTTQNIPIERQSLDSLQENLRLNRVPHPSHRHAAPSAPWPWVDIGDGLFFWLHLYRSSSLLIKFTDVDRRQLECAEPPIPKQCDHRPETCNRCWKGYPQSLFPNWTQWQVKKAKIYDIIHNYSKIRPCVFYRVDVTDRGLFTRTRGMKAVYGVEDIIWDNMIHEQVSCKSYCMWSAP